MNCEYVRKTYGVPAEIGRRVIVDGKPGIIAADRGHYIGVNFDASKPGVIMNAHPTSEVEYLEMGTVRKPSKYAARAARFREYGDSFRSFIDFCRWDACPERSWNRRYPYLTTGPAAESRSHHHTHTMTPEQQRIAIAEATGVEPRKMWRYWYDAKRTHGAIALRSKEDAEAQRQREIDNWDSRWMGEQSISEPEEYDDWTHAPDYTGSLDAMHEAATCDAIIKVGYARYLACLGIACGTERLGALVFATAAQHAEAFLRTIGKWHPTSPPAPSPSPEASRPA